MALTNTSRSGAQHTFSLISSAHVTNKVHCNCGHIHRAESDLIVTSGRIRRPAMVCKA